MDEKKIARINQLAAKAKTPEGLTQEEREEQLRLRREAVPGRAWDGLGFARDTAGSLRDTVDRVLRAAFFRRESFPSTFDSSTASPAGHATMNRKMIRIQDPRSLSSFRGGLGGGDCRNSRSRSS